MSWERSGNPEWQYHRQSGGIVQWPVNGADASAATTVLLAGKQPILDTGATGNDVVQLYTMMQQRGHGNWKKARCRSSVSITKKPG